MTEQRPSKDLVSRLRRGEACIDAGHRCRSMDANAGCICAQTADEIERLGQSLATANANHERFEREWYLRGDEIERLQAEVTEVSEQYTNYHDWAQDEIERARRTSEYWKAEHLAGNAEIERLQHKIDTCGLQCSATLKSLVAENDRLRTALTGIQSCSTCSACRGAATRALGDDRLQRIEALLDAEPGTPAGVELNRFVDEQMQSEADWSAGPSQPPGDGQ